MTNNNTVPVWDILVRIFHWSLVIAFTVSYISSEKESAVHIYSGYSVLGLISFRVIWGLVGSKYARFSDFVYSPTAVLDYLKGLWAKTPRHFLGHNPAGGWMILALLVALFVITLSGLKLNAFEKERDSQAGNAVTTAVITPASTDRDQAAEPGQERHRRHGPRSAGERFWHELHEVAANLTLVLIALHIAGVIVSSRLHRENLVKAMITGKKQIKPES